MFDHAAALRKAGLYSGAYLQTSLKQLVLGNYTEDVSLLGTLLQILAGVVNVDLPMDVRDLFYDVTNFEPTAEHIAQTLLDAVALLPVVGGIKYVDEAGDVVKAGAKSIDEAGDVLKSADNIADTAKLVKKNDCYDHLPKNLHMGRHGKHVVGHNNYQKWKNRSILTITPETAEALIRKFSGTGEYISDTTERIDFGMIIGKYVVEETGAAYDTTRGTIRYSKDGAHIVPAKPKGWED